ncbi:hypothetical protein DL769_010662 [Monosporascus sp. CRB-8-3]|nr:hypothetical protein DL769_010662 [Monosporascus sp. CRB-8-3]
MRCESLNVIPLEFHPSSAGIRAQLLERDRTFQQLTGQHFRHYNGVDTQKSVDDCNRLDRFYVNGRVVIDYKTYYQWQPDYGLKVYKECADQGDDVIFDEFLEEDLLVTSPTVRGFDSTDRRFLEFFVNNLSPIEWDETCFDQLLLDLIPKRTVQALGKGKGFVIVLHGPPGVGKTLTAECVAESVHRPLYTVAAGDLGTDRAYLETQLRRIMQMISTWRAVLLVDEADVLLERRSLHDMKRNTTASVFLRVLEYDAFTRRILVLLRYPNLTEASRRTIWSNFCDRVPAGTDITEKQLDQLAKHELNCRQIKNIVKSAESLAAFEGRKVDAAQLEGFTKVQGEFERDWMGFVDVNE